MPIDPQIAAYTRRAFFSHASCGIGAAALASLETKGFAAESPDTSTGGLRDLPHHQPQARRAIYLFMSGAPSQMDMWDHKPKMADWYDKELPDHPSGPAVDDDQRTGEASLAQHLQFRHTAPMARW